MAFGQVGQNLRQSGGGGAADACVDLVENEGARLVARAYHHLASKHDARKLAAGSNAIQGLRLQIGAGREEQLETLRSLRAPLRARQILEFARDVGVAHLQACHLLAHQGGETRKRLRAGLGQGASTAQQLGLRRIKGGPGFFKKLIAIVVLVQNPQSLVVGTANIFHAGAEAAHQRLKAGKPFLPCRQLGRIELDGLRVRGQLTCNILDSEESFAQMRGILGAACIQGCHPVKRAERLLKHLQDAGIALKRTPHEFKLAQNSFGMLVTRHLGQQGIVFAWERIHCIHLIDHVAGAIKGDLAFLRDFVQAIKLGLRGASGLKGTSVFLQGHRHLFLGPCIEQGKLMFWVQKTLMLMLAAQIDARADAGSKLLHAGRHAVERDARAALRLETTDGNIPLLGRALQIKTPLDGKGILPLANHAGLGPLARKKLERREQRGFAGARLAGDDGKPRARCERGLADQRNIGNMQFVEHASIPSSRP